MYAGSPFLFDCPRFARQVAKPLPNWLRRFASWITPWCRCWAVLGSLVGGWMWMVSFKILDWIHQNKSIMFLFLWRSESQHQETYLDPLRKIRMQWWMGIGTNFWPLGLPTALASAFTFDILWASCQQVHEQHSYGMGEKCFSFWGISFCLDLIWKQGSMLKPFISNSLFFPSLVNPLKIKLHLDIFGDSPIYPIGSPGTTDRAAALTWKQPVLQTECYGAAWHCGMFVRAQRNFFSPVHWGAWSFESVLDGKLGSLYIAEDAWSWTMATDWIMKFWNIFPKEHENIVCTCTTIMYFLIPTGYGFPDHA